MLERRHWVVQGLRVSIAGPAVSALFIIRTGIGAAGAGPFRKPRK